MEWFFSFLKSLGNFLLHQGLTAVVILVVGVLAIRILIRIVAGILERSKLEKTAHKLILSLIRAVLYILLGLIVASKLGIDVTGVIALASVLTLAVSLSVQNALTNVIGGFTLLYTHPFQSGDYVEVAGQSGTVSEIGLTYTKLNTPDNKVVSIPNSAVVSANIVNYTVTGTRRVDIVISASYDAPIAKVLEVLRTAADVPSRMQEIDPFVAVNNFGDSAISYVVRVWSTTDNYWPTLYAINEKIKAEFDANGIEMTYPHLNVHLDK